MAFDPTKFGAVPVEKTVKFDPTQFGATPVDQNTSQVSQPIKTTQPFTAFPATGKEGYLEQAGKTLGNLPGSAFNFVKSTVDMLNPVNIWNNIKKTPDEFGALVKESGGVGQAIIGTAKEMPKAAYEGIVPQFARSLISGDTEGAQKALAEDPVGQIAPFILLGKVAAERAGVGAQFDAAINKVASPVNKMAETVSDFAKGAVNKSAKFGVSQATGLNPKSIEAAINDPKALGEALKSNLTRETTAEQVRGAIDMRLKQLSETGQEYSTIRQSPTFVDVPADIIPKTLSKFGLSLDEKGQIKSTIESRPISNTDRIALQGFIDQFGNQSTLSPNAFLNAREALSNLSKYEAGKTKIPQLIAKELRYAYDEAGKKQIPGLQQLDEAYAPERQLLSKLKTDYIEKNTAGGIKLKDAAINKIANSVGVGKDAQLARLEELIPGITKQVKMMKVIEDIQNSTGQKVGTYARAGGLVGGVLTMNPYLIVGSILSVPEIAVPLLRGIGYTMPKIKSTLDMLGVPFKELNKLPDTVTSGFAPK